MENLQLAVNNARFMILPWIHSKGLASKILSTVNRKLLTDWHQRYGYRPVLVGQTVVRGKKRPCAQPNHTHQGHLAVPDRQKLPWRFVPINRPAHT